MAGTTVTPGAGSGGPDSGYGPGAGPGRPPSPVVPAGRFVWLLVGGLVAVLFIGAGAVNAAGWLARHTLVQDQTYRHAVTRIVIDGGSGNLELTPGADGEVAVHRHLAWSWKKPVIDEHWDGDTLVVDYRCTFIDFGPGCGVDYRLRVPAGVDVQARAGSGQIRIQGVTGALALTTGSGNVSVTGSRGALALRTGSGNITATGIGSSQATAHTGSGNIRLSFDSAPDSVTSGTGSGSVTVLVPSRGTYRVTAHAGSGNVNVAVANDPAAVPTITVNTGSGNITVGYQ